MKLRFFADQCVPGSVIRALREEGHAILRLKDSIAPDSPDPVVLAKAQQLDAILLSLNGDPSWPEALRSVGPSGAEPGN